MRILILNWRDIKNPQGGGAEALTHEMARRWVHRGHTVTIFTSRFSEGKHEEEVDGVRIIRKGTWWTVHAHAFYYYLFHGGSFDIVVDEVHWFPFFSGLYARKRTVLLACEVARKLFFALFPYPLALIGRFIEKIYLRVYQNVPVLAISSSTKADLVCEGFNPGNITVIPMGITVPRRLPNVLKEKNPTLIYVGRINKQKGIEDALVAFRLVHKQIPAAKFWVVGSGDAGYKKKIVGLIDEWGLTRSVDFFGYVSLERKFLLLARAHLLLFPSLHEGWGLVVHEAGLVSTPAISYNVSGLKDAIKHARSGILVDPRPDALADAVVGVLVNSKYYTTLQRGAKEEAKTHTWERTAGKALQFLKTL